MEISPCSLAGRRTQKEIEPVIDWLPSNKLGAVCFSIDDIHPARSTDVYEAGGDLEKGALGHVRWLLERHPRLRVTLFTTADWREISPVPTRRLLASLPLIRDKFYLTKIWPKGKMRLDRHPEFVDYLRELPRTEIALHGLHHCHKGMKIPVEFQGESRSEIRKTLQEALSIFETAGLEFVPGICPPGWNASPAMLDALSDLGLSFVASARDLATPVSRDAVTNMSGMKGVSLILPQFIHKGRLLHITSNFQFTSPFERAMEIIENGGLLAIKAHIIKVALGHISLDGLDEMYRNYLDQLFTVLETRYGDSLLWTSMGELTKSLRNGGGHREGNQTREGHAVRYSAES